MAVIVRRVAALLVAVLLCGCHAVWTHPSATAEKYDRDLYYCRYGVEPDLDPNPTEAAVRERALLSLRRDWKQCMMTLGWTKTTHFGASGQAWAADQ